MIQGKFIKLQVNIFKKMSLLNTYLTLVLSWKDWHKKYIPRKNVRKTKTCFDFWRWHWKQKTSFLPIFVHCLEAGPPKPVKIWVFWKCHPWAKSGWTQPKIKRGVRWMSKFLRLKNCWKEIHIWNLMKENFEEGKIDFTNDF